MATKGVRGRRQRRGTGEAKYDAGGRAASAIIPLVNRFSCGSSGWRDAIYILSLGVDGAEGKEFAVRSWLCVTGRITNAAGAPVAG